MGVDYKQKYLKYKIKYLNAKKKFRGGAMSAAEVNTVLATMDSAGCPKRPLSEVYDILKVLEQAKQSIPSRDTGPAQATETHVRLIVANKFTEIITTLKTALEELVKKIKKEDDNFINTLTDAQQLNEAFYGDEYNPSDSERGIINKWAAGLIERTISIPDILKFIKETIDTEFKKTQTVTVFRDGNTLDIDNGHNKEIFKKEDAVAAD